MANRCDQKISLYGLKEKVKEVIDYIKSNRTDKFPDGNIFTSTRGEFITTVFPNSLCFIDVENVIHLETTWDSAKFLELTALFPDVGFRSAYFMDGIGEGELRYVINGEILYVDFRTVGFISSWEKTTKSKFVRSGGHIKYYLKPIQK